MRPRRGPSFPEGRQVERERPGSRAERAFGGLLRDRRAPRPPAVIRTMAFSPLFLPVGQLVPMAEGCERAKRRRGRSHLPPEGLLRRGRVWAPLAEE